MKTQWRKKYMEAKAEIASLKERVGYLESFEAWFDAALTNSVQLRKRLTAEENAFSKMAAAREKALDMIEEFQVAVGHWTSRAIVAERDLQRREKELGLCRTTITHLIGSAKGWCREHNMYRNAWQREMGGVIRCKTHEIDGFVLRTRDIYQASLRVPELEKELERAKMESKIFLDHLNDERQANAIRNEQSHLQQAGHDLLEAELHAIQLRDADRKNADLTEHISKLNEENHQLVLDLTRCEYQWKERVRWEQQKHRLWQESREQYHARLMEQLVDMYNLLPQPPIIWKEGTMTPLEIPRCLNPLDAITYAAAKNGYPFGEEVPFELEKQNESSN